MTFTVHLLMAAVASGYIVQCAQLMSCRCVMS